MTYPSAYIDYLVYFHAERDYFECHEVMEEYWKEHPDDSYKDVWHICIQLAVTAYHERRGNVAGAFKMLNQARNRMRGADIPVLVGKIGLDAERLHTMMVSWLAKLEIAITALQQESAADMYEDPNLPIADPTLEQLCKEEAERRGHAWLAPSQLQDAALINKHTLRDRTDVIQARLEAKEQKKKTSDIARTE